MKQSSFILLLFTILFSGCREDCETIVRPAIKELPSNFEKQFFGLLNNSRWVLVTYSGDTITISAQGPLEEEVSYSYFGGNRADCYEEYKAERFFYRDDLPIRNDLPNNANSDLKVSAFNDRIMNVGSNFFWISFQWSLINDDWNNRADAQIIFPDSINVGGQYYYNAFHQTESGFLFEPEIGIIGIIDQGKLIATLSHYE
jgi:hypothetical protein